MVRPTVRLGLAVVLVCAAAPGCSSSPPAPTSPAAAEAALERGRTALGQGRIPAALEDFEVACGTPQACTIVMDLAGEAYRKSQDFEAAVDFYSAVLERHPTLAGRARSYRAYFLERAGKVREAIAEYRAGLRLEPSARFFGLLGSLLLRLDETEGAIAAYRNGLRLAPGDPELTFLLSRAYRIRGELDTSRALLEQVLEAVPGHGSAWANLGRVLMMSGDLAGASTALHRSVEVDPRNIEARFLLARMALRAGRTDEAAQWLREILAIEETLGRGPVAT